MARRHRSQAGESKKSPSDRGGNRISKFFDHFAARVTKWVGSPFAFGGALIVVLLWAVSGPAFGYSETWQLVINT
ncbi:MAG: low affinity iron permease family protein, partial [Pseudomonadales bacterium]